MDHEQALLRATRSAQPRFDFSGEWTNRRSSTMNIIEESGVLIGVFLSVSGGEEEPVSGQLSGQAEGDIVAFTVRWPSSGITAWVGRHHQEDDKDVIDALWQMTAIEDEGGAGFRHSIYAGADRFVRARDAGTGSDPKHLARYETADDAPSLDEFAR